MFASIDELVNRKEREDKQRAAKSIRKELIMTKVLKRFSKSLTLGVILLASLAFAAACTHRKVVQLDSHKITVARHGFEKKLQITELRNGPMFEYAGVSTDGKGMKVSIEGHKIIINGVDGRLRPGDSVLIGDEGVAVNSLDYGETEKYLRANGSGSDTSSLNQSAQ